MIIEKKGTNNKNIEVGCFKGNEHIWYLITEMQRFVLTCIIFMYVFNPSNRKIQCPRSQMKLSKFFFQTAESGTDVSVVLPSSSVLIPWKLKKSNHTH